MDKSDAAIRRKIRLIEQHVAELAQLTPTDGHLADSCGHTREIEVSLGTTRRRWESLVVEMEPIAEPQGERVNPNERAGTPVVEGVDYEMVPQFKTTRSYNDPAIITSMAQATDTNPTDALMNAISGGACKLEWRWTQLKKYLYAIDAEMRVVHHEVAPHSGLDEGMVGEVRTRSGVKRVPLKREG